VALEVCSCRARRRNKATTYVASVHGSCRRQLNDNVVVSRDWRYEICCQHRPNRSSGQGEEHRHLPGVNAGENELCIHSDQRGIEDYMTGPGEWGSSIRTCTILKSIRRILFQVSASISDSTPACHSGTHPQMELSLGVEPSGTRESWVRLPGRETLFALFHDEGFMRDVVRNEPSEAEHEARSEGATCGAGGQTPHAVRALSQVPSSTWFALHLTPLYMEALQSSQCSVIGA
jgi:hypothetical protein